MEFCSLVFLKEKVVPSVFELFIHRQNPAISRSNCSSTISQKCGVRAFSLRSSCNRGSNLARQTFRSSFFHIIFNHVRLYFLAWFFLRNKNRQPAVWKRRADVSRFLSMIFRRRKTWKKCLFLRRKLIVILFNSVKNFRGSFGPTQNRAG